MKTSKEQLEHVKDWERRNRERAQARKNNWFKTPKGLAWIKKNQKRRNAKRKLWRARKRRQAANAVTQTRRADDFENTTDDNPAVV